MSPHPYTCDVLVVGAGPAGLTTAAGLARAGVRVLVVDRHAGTTIFPKAAGIRPRTLEILRSWGLEQRAMAAAQHVRLEYAVSPVLSGPVVAVESLGTPDPDRVARLSPSRFVFIPQDALEPVLLDHVRERGGDVRFGTQLTGFEQDSAGVRAYLRPRDSSGPGYEVHARYLVGADGPASSVRERLGIGVDRLGSEDEHFSVLFDADLDAVQPDPPFALTGVTAPGAEGLFVAAGRHRWSYNWIWDPDHDDLAVWTPERLTERIRTAAGVPDLDLRLGGTFRWTFGAEAATSFRSGRAFLVGDAATRTTPRRATGLNTGVAAAHNLAWKLAWVLRGWAGEALLETYDQERRPVGRANAVRSLQQVGEVREAADVEDFGTVYASDAISRDSGDVAPGSLAVAGHRAPHGWTTMAGRRLSTLDLFDGRFTLLTGSAGGAWRLAADRLTAGSPLAALRLGPDLGDPDGTLAVRYGVSEGGAVLVRPDGFVAWRTRSAGPDAEAMLATALARATRRTSTGLPVRIDHPEHRLARTARDDRTRATKSPAHSS